jgi:glycosyltransferase involved in cell wall biosynthesis
VFTVFPSVNGNLRFSQLLRDWLQTQSSIKLVWCSDVAVTPLAAMPFSRERAIPFLLEVQENFFEGTLFQSPKRLLSHWLAVRAAKVADRVRVCTPKHAEALKRLRVPAERITTIPTRVDTTLFDPTRYDRAATRAELGFPGDSFLILGIGNLIPRKAFHHAIECLKDLPQHVHLLLVGEGPERARLEALSERLVVKRRVHLLGRRRYFDIPRILAASDALVHPSYSEGMPRAVHEAQAMKKPVVCSAIDGMVDQVIDGVSGFLCPRGATQPLSRALLSLMNDQEMRVRMGAAGRAHVMTNFDSQKVMGRWQTLLNSLLAPNSGQT